MPHTRQIGREVVRGVLGLRLPFLFEPLHALLELRVLLFQLWFIHFLELPSELLSARFVKGSIAASAAREG
jgi:hypothetical protein